MLKTQERKLLQKLIQVGCRFSYDQPKTLNWNVKDLQRHGFSYIKVEHKTRGPAAMKDLKDTLPMKT